MKSRLRHSIRSIREPFGKAGLTVAVIALVFAMMGGAWAASNSGSAGSGDKATASAKAKRGPRGPRGPQGPAGPAGPAGLAGAKGDKGAAGANGTNGTDGTNGTNGTDGTDGKSVLHGEGAPVDALDGTNGDFYIDTETDTLYGPKAGGVWPTPGTALKGSPWTAGGTLPVNSTETGAWGYTVESAGPGATRGRAPISFSIPLAGELDLAHTIINPASGAANANCENTNHTGAASTSNPEAKSGYLCVYPTIASPAGAFPGVIAKPVAGFSTGAATAGAVVIFFSEDEGDLGKVNQGTFAVTG
jgi:hypothetical protein